MIRTFRALALVALVAVAACGGSDDDTAASSDPTAPLPATTDTSDVSDTTEPNAAATTITTESSSASTTATVTTTESPGVAIEVGDWISIAGGDDCVCSDGSEFELWQRPADPTRVVLFFEGGGACFSAETCGPLSPIYTKNLELGEQPRGSGIFDADNAENPFGRYSMVYVPYCTGDAHLGDRVNRYSDSLTISHSGFDNASKGLETVISEFPDVEQLVVAGSSAGSIPAPAFAGLAADALPDAEIIAVGDASGAYPDVPELNARIGAEWGVLENVPDWPVTNGLTARQWSFPGLYVQAGTQHPDITFARFDHAFDGVQSFFSGLLDIDASDLLGMIEATEAQIEAAGVPVASYIAPGDDHTILGSDEFYDLEVEGVRLVDWVTTLADGDVPADVRCTDCR